ncbi:MAG: DUF4124 domain-containing protein [Gammaproteobacteria bacterium]
MGKIQTMRNKRLFTSIFLASFCLFIQPPLYAGVYKWVDENGQVHYGEQPGNTGAEKITIRQNETTKPRPINKAEEDAAESDPNNTDKQTEKFGEWEEVPPSKKEKRKLCNEAKSDLTAISSRGRMREINEKGEHVYLTEQQRQQRISAARKKQQEFCR